MLGIYLEHAIPLKLCVSKSYAGTSKCSSQLAFTSDHILAGGIRVEVLCMYFKLKTTRSLVGYHVWEMQSPVSF